MTALSERSARVVRAARLQRRAERTATGRFLAEGPNLVEAAARAGVIEEVFATEVAAQRHRPMLAGLTVHTVSDRAMKALSETVTPAGVVGVCRRTAEDLATVLARRPGLVVVGAGIADPGNAGTMIRLAEAMGAGAAVFCGEVVDPYNGKSVRSSAGSIFAVPTLLAGDTGDLIDRLRGAGMQILATTLTGELSLDAADDLLGAPTAWIFGREAEGLPEAVAVLADHRVVIPMAAGIDSLNVAAAAAICLYQSARAQRRSSPLA